MKKFKITVEKEIEVEFDETSEEFKQLFEQYIEYFDKDAGYEELAENVALMIAKYGIEEFIEGVGFVKHEGENQTIVYDGEFKEREGIINVNVGTNLNGMVDFDISYTEEVK